MAHHTKLCRGTATALWLAVFSDGRLQDPLRLSPCCFRRASLINVTGTPSYIAKIKPGRFPLVLRNLHIPAIMLNFLVMTLLMAVVPMEKVLAAENVLSLLAEVASLFFISP